MSSGFQQSQPRHLYPISNRRTPSTKRHINSLPSELLGDIFSCYCCLRYGPLPLLLVCRLWHAIASDCWALRGNIYYEQGAYSYRSTEKPISEIQLRENPIFCDRWAKFQWAVKRAGTAPLNLQFKFFDTHELRKRQDSEILFLTRGRELALLLPGTPVAFLNDLPALEHLEFYQQFGNAEVDQLLKGIEQGSPLLWSLKLSGWSIACPAHLSTLLRRIRCLDVGFDLRGVRSSLQIPCLAFPKLLSLTIWNTQLGVDEFPVLDRLTLHENWPSLPLIVAPKLTKLILRSKRNPNIPLAHLLRATVRPTSLVLSDASFVTDLPELLNMWSSLLELHLEYEEANVMSQVSLATLGGNRDRDHLCPRLRYLTVHVNQGQRDPTVTGQIIQTLHAIVEERKRYDTDELRRVICVWGWSVSGTGYVDKPKEEIEWVDML